MKLLAISLFFLFAAFQSNAQKAITVAFYNVENLFDTINNKKTQDEDFLPKGKLKWGTERYFSKLNHIAKVIDQLGGDEGPDILGLCEVENKRVLNDLVNMPLIRSKGYDIIHFDSPDERGIDVALLYKKVKFKLVAADAVKIHFPLSIEEQPKELKTQKGTKRKKAKKQRIDRTRDILVATLVFNKADTFTFIVNHFPSRLGGQDKSEPKRLFVAQTLRSLHDDIMKENYHRRVIMMGDFNDEPADRSIKETLACKYDINNLSWNDLYNPMLDLKNEGKGSISYKKQFEMIDQFILSNSLCLQGEKVHYIQKTAMVFNPDWMQEQDERWKGQPFRTFAGEKYLNGYSDHFPVYLKIAY
ncbi:MAG: endonuclease/exonuclease/phosphatase family protein [Flavobacteriaceae bacterium]|nr:endonuclease/exonuclease/phosphatase family protein [Flavobacteriaceae bacterium]